MTNQRVIRIVAATATLVAAGSLPAYAGDYAFDLPQLVGQYLGDMPAAPIVEAVVDLGMPFAEITGATLLLGGVHAPGIFGDLNSPGTFQATAEVLAWLPQTNFLSAYVDQFLPMPGGAFEFSAPWRASPSKGYAADLSSWRDGTAELKFVIGGPIMIATTYTIEPPGVAINSATLVIHGQPELDAFMLLGDFNRDGEVDDADLTVWQEMEPGDGGEFLAWQRNRSDATTPNLVATGVPEPTTLVGLLAAAMVLGAARRRAGIGCTAPF